jgi:molybdopterin synthase catalytic subunit
MDPALLAPRSGDDWVALSGSDLPVQEATRWVGRPDCGATVVFTGNARDHAEGRPAVHRLEYEAYDEQVVSRLEAISAQLRRQWPTVGRVVLLHRTGPVAVGESSVVVAVSAPHRDEAFAAARFGIDTLKATVPIWKKEIWDGGSEWGLDAQPIADLADLAAPDRLTDLPSPPDPAHDAPPAAEQEDVA